MDFSPRGALQHGSSSARLNPRAGSSPPSVFWLDNNFAQNEVWCEWLLNGVEARAAPSAPLRRGAGRMKDAEFELLVCQVGAEDCQDHRIERGLYGRFVFDPRVASKRSFFPLERHVAVGHHYAFQHRRDAYAVPYTEHSEPGQLRPYSSRSTNCCGPYAELRMPS
jgi:hypothetical protein